MIILPPTFLDSTDTRGVLRAINHEHNLNLLPSQLEFMGVPVDNPDPDAGRVNTLIEIAATEFSPFIGSKVVGYHRNDMTVQLQTLWGPEAIATMNMRGFSTLHEALRTFNWIYGFDLSPNDVANHLFDQQLGFYSIVLEANPESWLYTGTMDLHLINLDWDDARLTDRGFRITDEDVLRTIESEEQP